MINAHTKLLVYTRSFVYFIQFDKPIIDTDTLPTVTEPTADTASPDRVLSPGGVGEGRAGLLRQDTILDHPGMETLEEAEEKEDFFAKIEGSTQASVDYGKLNKALDLETTNDSMLK